MRCSAAVTSSPGGAPESARAPQGAARLGPSPPGSVALKPRGRAPIPGATMSRALSDDPRDEGPLADLVSGGMWLLAGVVGLLALQIPGSSNVHTGVAVAIALFAVLWGGVSFALSRADRAMT